MKDFNEDGVIDLLDVEYLLKNEKYDKINILRDVLYCKNLNIFITLF